MNLIALLAGLLPWAATPVSAFSRIYVACSVLSLEAQAATWLGRGTLDSLVPLNLLLAVVAAGWQMAAGRSTWQWVGLTKRLLPMPVVLGLFAVVISLNLWRPVEAADPYELDRLRQIEDVGTLRYSADIDPKANIVGGFYELVLGDLHGVPRVGPVLVQFHGIIGLLIVSLAFAAAQTWLPIVGSIWASAVVFTIPVVFHQLVLIKSDLFIGAPAFVALAWAVGSVGRAHLREVWWAGWLAGLVVAAKLTNSAVALAVGVSVLARDRSWRPLVTTGAAVVAGMVAAGILLTFWQNARFYGDPFAVLQVENMGNLNHSVGEALLGLSRFVISFFDWSLITRMIWPGRGGWGGTFGLPFIWALIVLIASSRTQPIAGRALLAGGVCLVAFGLTFPDADVAHRLAMGPALLIVVAGASVAQATGRRWAVRILPIVVVLSAAQILRSAMLYFVRV